MNRAIKPLVLACLAVSTLLTVSCASGPGGTTGIDSTIDARVLQAKSQAALDKLYHNNPTALLLAKNADGVLVFPKITKGGLLIGGALGDGALFERNNPTGFYRSISASYGLQFGLQKYGYALFLMDDKALNTLKRSGGWEAGSSPNLVVLNQGSSASLTTTTANKGIYAIGFDYLGLMAGLSLEGTKVTRLNIEP